jgi:hypothetical protein
MEKNKWVEINKPWESNIELKRPEFPDVQQKIIDRFGCDIEDFNEQFEKENGKEAPKFKWEFFNRLYLKGLNGETNDFDELFELSDDIQVVKARKHIAKWKEMCNFRESLPEVISWNEKYDKITKREQELNKESSFRKSDFHKPGVLIETKLSDGKTKKYLIGHINKNAGVCDDCMAFEPDDIVLRAKILIDEKDME